MNVVTCRLADTSFRMLVTNDWERNRANTLATKEPETVRWIMENVRAGDTLFDIGANNGIYTLLAAAHAPGGRVVAVEPMAATFARLCENIVLNGFTNVERPRPGRLPQHTCGARAREVPARNRRRGPNLRA